MKIVTARGRLVAPLLSVGDLVMALRQLLNLKQLAEQRNAPDSVEPGSAEDLAGQPERADRRICARRPRTIVIRSGQPWGALMSDTGQPPITPESGIVSLPWQPGPHERTQAPVVVSFTDFRAASEADLHAIVQTGTALGDNWPIMTGAVGLWLWSKPAELRGGSLSVWLAQEDLKRFIRWPVHTEIMRAWRDRIEVLSDSWEDARFVPEVAWSRAEVHMRRPRTIGIQQ